MLYQKPSFSVPASTTEKLTCDGPHAMADVKGKCIRCGEYITDKPQHDLDATRQGRWTPGR